MPTDPPTRDGRPGYESAMSIVAAYLYHDGHTDEIVATVDEHDPQIAVAGLWVLIRSLAGEVCAHRDVDDHVPVIAEHLRSYRQIVESRESRND